MGKDCKNGVMEDHTMECFLMIREMVKECMNGLTEESLMVCGRQERCMELVNYSSKMENLKKEDGNMEQELNGLIKIMTMIVLLLKK